jgi:hypothetical protein
MATYSFYKFSPRGFSNETHTYKVRDDIADDWARRFERSLDDFTAERFDACDEAEALRLMRSKQNRYGQHQTIESLD